MHTRIVDGILIRPLRSGEAATVAALFERLGDAGPARVDATRHVLVAHVDGDPLPAGVARLVRHGASAEVACAVADRWQGRGIGRALVLELAALARAAGVTELRVTVRGDDPRAVSLLARLARAGRRRREDGELELAIVL